jgi:prophage tail gpP-like protein
MPTTITAVKTALSEHIDMDGIAELKVDGVFYGGWKRVRVSRSIEQMAGSFDIEITERWPGQPERTPIRPGQKCQLLLDRQPVITGWVDVVSPDYDADQHTLRVIGRDATCDLVDCSAIHKTGQWHDVTIDQMARDLIKPFGVALVMDAEPGAPFDSFDIQEGESVFECLERAARVRALLLTSDPEGRLVITRAGRIASDVALIEGKNIKAARADFSWAERFSEYHVKGYDRLGEDGETEDAAPTATTRDENITRHRPLIVIAEAHGENASFADRAEWEKTIRRGRSCRGSITVQGWLQGADAALWMPNTLVTVTSPLLWLDNAEMLIVGSTYSLDDQSGTLTELAIARPDAFELLAGVSQSKVFGKLKTREQRKKREAVEDWSKM